MRVKIVLLVVVVVSVFVFVFNSPLEGSTPTTTVVGGRDVVHLKIGNGTFNVRVAETQTERARGLGGVRALATGEGMLFEFPTNAPHAIWMKNMLIPIDIVWLSDALSVIDLKENVSPDSFPQIFTPKSPARFVVELGAGSAKAFHINEGSPAEIFAE